jgi:hypothetical protein
MPEYICADKKIGMNEENYHMGRNEKETRRYENINMRGGEHTSKN